MSRAERRVVVIRPDDKLGETLLATPVFQAIKEAVPEAKIDAWVGHHWRSVIEASPWLDAVRGVPYRPRLTTYWKLASALRQQRPEAVLILRPDTRRYAQIARFAGVKARVGAVVYRPRVARLLTHVVPLNPCAHQVERNLAVVEAWLGRELPRHPTALRARPARQVARRPHTLEPLRRAAPKHWRGAAAVDARPIRGGRQATSTGHLRADACSHGRVRTQLPMSEQCARHLGLSAVNLVGQTSILDLAEIVRHAALLVSVDTGVVHLAAAVGTPCVSLHFRRDYPPENWYAWQVPTVPVSPQRYCEGCTQHACRLKDFTCVQSVSVDQVIAAVDTLLAQCGNQPRR
jgi:ADP-heptose:LPS heptosyltransferase